jgi:hypothetical protein
VAEGKMPSMRLRWLRCGRERSRLLNIEQKNQAARWLQAAGGGKTMTGHTMRHSRQSDKSALSGLTAE